MRSLNKFRISAIAVLLVLVVAAMGVPAAATGPFVEADATPYITFNGEVFGDGFGWEAENLGDINQDGINDVIISAPLYPVDGTPGGKAYVYSGADGSLLNAVTGNAWDQFGYSVADAGDVNADGIPDYIVGGRGTSTADGSPIPYQGRAVVYSGADHSILHAFVGPQRSGYGYESSKAGDVNADGYDDVFVSAPYLNGQAGRVYLYSGKDGTPLWTRDGKAAGDFLGTALGFAGDINHDGVPDLTAGAIMAGKGHGGEVYVYSGDSGDTLMTLTPPAPGSSQSFGWFFASGAGDVNNDGTPDIYVGDFYNKKGGGTANGRTGGTGRVYIFSGSDGSLIYTFEAENKLDGLGPMRGAGDVNGDGYADLFMAAFNSSDGAPSGGKAYLRSGKDGSLMRTITGKIAGDQLGFDALAVGDVTGDGLTDYLLTAAGNSTTDADFGRAYIVPGIP